MRSVVLSTLLFNSVGRVGNPHPSLPNLSPTCTERVGLISR